jgi:hypothetical protein
MFKNFLLRMAKSFLAETVDDILQAVIDEVQQEVTKLEKLTEKERATANMVLDLVEARALQLIAEKLQKL